jgi:dynein intermediate chain
VWDLTVDTEVPLSKAQPSSRKEGRSMMSKSLNRIAWEQTEGKRLAVGGLDGAVTVFEVGPDLGGKDSARNEEWTSVKKLVARLESTSTGKANGV